MDTNSGVSVGMLRREGRSPFTTDCMILMECFPDQGLVLNIISHKTIPKLYTSAFSYK